MRLQSRQPIGIHRFALTSEKRGRTNLCIPVPRLAHLARHTFRRRITERNHWDEVDEPGAFVGGATGFITAATGVFVLLPAVPYLRR
jgi:hypothetical protein